MKILVINCGSSSVKYQVVDTTSGSALAFGVIERVGEGARTHDDAISEVLARTKEHPPEAVGHRVVHGGERFVDASLIDDSVVEAIEACVPLAPLHNPANVAGIRAARRALPRAPQVAVFDTAFHGSMPRRARTYAISEDTARAHGVRRYGFHGLSHQYVSRRAAEHLGQDLRTLRLVTLHLGNGCSACAIENGSSVETSMGMTPLEGLVMGTRSGDIDAGAVLALARAMGVDDAERVLQRSSGLLGLSGVSNDLRDIQQRAADGDDRARLAIAVFAHRVRKYIGAYAAVMGGLDAVVLTGGIGQNSAPMRQRVLQRLEFLGLSIDDDANVDAKVDHERSVADISAETSRVKALVVATNEELEIARQAAWVVEGHTRVRRPGPIPIAVSARHVHLTRDAMDVLFGKGSELTVHKPLSQPGQFASDQTVALVGSRGRIDGVRVLGPLRRACQVEVSRTDEFKLGVDAPVRRSGHVAGSAPIALEGPAGTLKLTEGLICAWRHIHMTPADAAAYGVADGDFVEVAIEGGSRDLVFRDVMIRVHEEHVLEMHIDTDEANAAELSRGAIGDLVYATPPGAVATLASKR